MEKKIVNHFRKTDPILYSYIEKLEKFEWKESDPFSDLCDAIISQQLSEKAGETIWLRFKKLFKYEKVNPEDLLNIPDQTIRNSGISWAKIKSLKDLAQKVTNGSLDLIQLQKLDDEKVIHELTKVKGIGPWTAEMFLIFSLGREDIFSQGDLGLKRAIQKIYKLKFEPSSEEVTKIVKKWSPYKSYACRILWKVLAIKST